jgi:SAM-dependent methyltransferase
MTASATAGTTHEHLLSVLASSLPASPTGVRVLDAGCGAGALLGLLHEQLPSVRPDVTPVEVHGFDVVDQSLHAGDPLRSALDRLAAVDADVDWASRLSLVRPDDPWPYEDASFDAVVSNQVLEHVVDLDHFLGQTARVLRPGGSSHHMFPLRDYVWEGHLLLPLVHRIRSHDARQAYIRLLSRAGLGKYRPGSDLDKFAERHADYVHHLTTYRSWPQVADAAARAGLRVDYGWTLDYYRQKARRVRGRPLQGRYERAPSAAVQVASFHLLKRLASITVTLTREQTYVK